MLPIRASHLVDRPPSGKTNARDIHIRFTMIHQRTILIAEDTSEIRLMLTYYFLSKGYLVLDACNGDEALATGSGWAGRLDLLLADLDMPGMDGMELARRLKQIHRAIAVIYMSGVPGLLTGCDPAPLLCKPIDFDNLDKLVDGTLNGSRYRSTRKDLWHADN